MTVFYFLSEPFRSAVEVAEPSLFLPLVCVHVCVCGHTAEQSAWSPELGHLREQQAVGILSRAPSFCLMESLCAHTHIHICMHSLHLNPINGLSCLLFPLSCCTGYL